MPRHLRFLLRPGWLLLHLFTLAAIVTMILLGRWQLHVSERKHFDLQNFGYTLQWWLFSGFAGFFWWRIVRDAVRHRGDAGETKPTPAEADPAAPQSVAYRRYVMPAATAAEDPELRAYNDYLSRLNAGPDEEAT